MIHAWDQVSFSYSENEEEEELPHEIGESRGESTTFQKNVSLKDNVLDRDIFLLWSITHKCGLSIPSGIFYKCKTTSV